MRRILISLAAAAVVAGVFAATAAATHSWGNYHWARTSNPFTLKVGDNVTDTAYSSWESALDLAIADWSRSSKLDLVEVAGATAPRKCRPTSGRVEVCNATYGANGWLGLAQIWLSGGHISQGVAKMNDTYFNSTRYSTAAERHVMCQEVGHDFGLGHQDESGADLNTCMDYANALDNPSPNQHDYDQLDLIYAHTDSSNSYAKTEATDGGTPVRVDRNDRIKDSVVTEHFRDGSMRITHIFWAVGSPRAEHAHHDD